LISIEGTGKPKFANNFSKFLASFQITVNIININIIYVLVNLRIYHRYNLGKSQETFHRMEALNTVNVFTH